MALFSHLHSVDFSYEGKSFGLGMLNNISLEPPSVAFSGESRYLTPLWVFGKADELSQSTTSGEYELMEAKIDPHDQILEDKIKAVLKLLTFREQRILVQFWSLRVVGEHQLLTTIDQPFGLGMNHDERLLSYRRVSQNSLYVVDKDFEEVDLSPLARVFKLGLPEWSSDLTNYSPKHFPEQEYAIRCNLRGYFVIPVFDTATRLCVGLLEFLASTKYTSFHYEVQQFEIALKTQKLTCRLQVLDDPTSNVNELEKIFNTMKVVCDTHQLPLAQTWALSPFTSVASREQVLEKSCNSFDSRCLGKVCMSTCSLPFYVRDLGLWPFREEGKKQHLDKSRGFVSRALLSGGSCFCEDVTKLGKEVYPLVDYARMSGLTSCFTIYLHGFESNNDYVLEFFLPSHMKESKDLLNLVQMLKKNLEIASGFELGDKSFIEVMDLGVNNQEPDITERPLYMMSTFSDGSAIARTKLVNVPDESSSTIVGTTFANAGETSSPLKKGTKRKRGTKVTTTYGENIKRFRFCLSLGLLKLKYEVAKRFKLESQLVRLKYKDEENDLILLCGDEDLQPALVASGSNKNTINLICELST